MLTLSSLYYLSNKDYMQPDAPRHFPSRPVLGRALLHREARPRPADCVVTNVLLVDDSPSFLQSALRFLTTDGRIEVIGLALTGKDALEQVEALQPDLVLMDWAMPDMDGLEATRRLKAAPSSPRVIILTLHDTPEYRDAARQARADGYLCKSDFGLKLLPLIIEILAAPPGVPVEWPPSTST